MIVVVAGSSGTSGSGRQRGALDLLGRRARRSQQLEAAGRRVTTDTGHVKVQEIRVMLMCDNPKPSPMKQKCYSVCNCNNAVLLTCRRCILATK